MEQDWRNTLSVQRRTALIQKLLMLLQICMPNTDKAAMHSAATEFERNSYKNAASEKEYFSVFAQKVEELKRITQENQAKGLINNQSSIFNPSVQIQNNSLFVDPSKASNINNNQTNNPNVFAYNQGIRIPQPGMNTNVQLAQNNLAFNQQNNPQAFQAKLLEAAMNYANPSAAQNLGELQKNLPLNQILLNKIQNQQLLQKLQQEKDPRIIQFLKNNKAFPQNPNFSNFNSSNMDQSAQINLQSDNKNVINTSINNINNSIANKNSQQSLSRTPFNLTLNNIANPAVDNSISKNPESAKLSDNNDSTDSANIGGKKQPKKRKVSQKQNLSKKSVSKAPTNKSEASDNVRVSANQPAQVKSDSTNITVNNASSIQGNNSIINSMKTLLQSRQATTSNNLPSRNATIPQGLDLSNFPFERVFKIVIQNKVVELSLQKLFSMHVLARQNNDPRVLENVVTLLEQFLLQAKSQINAESLNNSELAKGKSNTPNNQNIENVQSISDLSSSVSTQSNTLLNNLQQSGFSVNSKNNTQAGLIHRNLSNQDVGGTKKKLKTENNSQSNFQSVPVSSNTPVQSNSNPQKENNNKSLKEFEMQSQLGSIPGTSASAKTNLAVSSTPGANSQVAGSLEAQLSTQLGLSSNPDLPLLKGVNESDFDKSNKISIEDANKHIQFLENSLKFKHNPQNIPQVLPKEDMEKFGSEFKMLEIILHQVLKTLPVYYVLTQDNNEIAKILKLKFILIDQIEAIKKAEESRMQVQKIRQNVEIIMKSPDGYNKYQLLVNQAIINVKNEYILKLADLYVIKAEFLTFLGRIKNLLAVYSAPSTSLVASKKELNSPNTVVSASDAKSVLEGVTNSLQDSGGTAANAFSKDSLLKSNSNVSVNNLPIPNGSNNDVLSDSSSGSDDIPLYKKSMLKENNDLKSLKSPVYNKSTSSTKKSTPISSEDVPIISTVQNKGTLKSVPAKRKKTAKSTAKEISKKRKGVLISETLKRPITTPTKGKNIKNKLQLDKQNSKRPITNDTKKPPFPLTSTVPTKPLGATINKNHKRLSIPGVANQATSIKGVNSQTGTGSSVKSKPMLFKGPTNSSISTKRTEIKTESNKGIQRKSLDKGQPEKDERKNRDQSNQISVLNDFKVPSQFVPRRRKRLLSFRKPFYTKYLVNQPVVFNPVINDLDKPFPHNKKILSSFPKSIPHPLLAPSKALLSKSGTLRRYSALTSKSKSIVNSKIQSVQDGKVLDKETLQEINLTKEEVIKDKGVKITTPEKPENGVAVSDEGNSKGIGIGIVSEVLTQDKPKKDGERNQSVDKEPKGLGKKLYTHGANLVDKSKDVVIVVKKPGNGKRKIVVIRKKTDDENKKVIMMKTKSFSKNKGLLRRRKRKTSNIFVHKSNNDSLASTSEEVSTNTPKNIEKIDGVIYNPYLHNEMLSIVKKGEFNSSVLSEAGSFKENKDLSKLFSSFGYDQLNV
ncbi:hypothetical protein BB560_004848 [Smittium megazygosporum]|uniref:Mediator complex subunit 15 KIX domain-containing protein n=1 Tax=Smittium megazygosporum TaxID=133381 RepID=A0A2T9Z7W0_9FUNG|nr:hypothetical protein BB560_004936 [Smittium megazygosporum]PVV00757.1 hypothetical protein BB560_004848 [Smittium megazygosporum]